MMSSISIRGVAIALNKPPNNRNLIKMIMNKTVSNKWFKARPKNNQILFVSKPIINLNPPSGKPLIPKNS